MKLKLRLLSLLGFAFWLAAGGSTAFGGQEVELKQMEPQNAVCLRTKVEMTSMMQTMGPLYGELFNHLKSFGAFPERLPPFALYHSRQGKEVDLEACLPIAMKVDSGDRVKFRQLPGGPAASLVHMGPYQDLGQSYQRLEKWMQDNGYKAAGPAREYYLLGPGHPAVSKASDYKTQIMWPIKKK